MFTLDKKSKRLIPLIYLLLLLSTACVSAEPDITTIMIDPPKYQVKANDEIHTFDVKINDVKNLNSWRMRVFWNPESLEIIRVTEGNFLKPNGQTFFQANTGDKDGYMEITCISLFTKESVNGNGTLAIMYFKIKGNSKIELENSFLYSNIDSQGIKGEIIHKSSGAEIRLKTSEQLPIAKIVYDGGPVIANNPVNFSGRNSFDPSGDKIVKYEWDFGDGSNSDQSEVSHTFKEVGKYTIKLTVTDDWGDKSEPSTIIIDVTENTPIYTYLLAGFILSAIIVCVVIYTRRR